MSFLQSTSNTAFFIALGIVVLLSGIGFGIVAWVGRLTGALRGREPVPINMLTEGYLLARGKASGRTLRAPLSGRPCVWWEMKVWERRIEIDRQASSDEPDRRASWTLLRHDVSRRPIHCTQGFVTCTVQPDGSKLEIFGSGGGAQVAGSLSSTLGYDVPLLGQVPLEIQVREGGDTGVPLVASTVESPAQEALQGVATALGARKRGLAGRRLGLSPL